MNFEDDEWWSVLVSSLASFSEVADREPHGLVVTANRGDGATAVVEIVMTPDGWDDLVSVSWGVVETAAQHVRQLVLDQPREQRYLVYRHYSGPSRPALRTVVDINVDPW